MIFNLISFDLDKAFSLKDKLVVLYADFNVINYLYENNIQLPHSFIFYPDSTALYFTIKYFLKKKIKKNISTDIQQSFLEDAIGRNQKLFFFGDSNQIITNVIKKLEIKFINAKIVGFEEGYNFDNEEVIQKINKSNAEILFVGLGVTRQEKWIINNYKKINAKIIIAVGGWFQYLAKNKKRAPLFLRKLHLEWLHKLVKEFPVVWRRYFCGIPLFFYRVITKKIQLVIKK